MSNIRVEKIPLHVPRLEELSKVLETALSSTFVSAQVSVVDCPDLSQSPFSLAAKGICGNARIADIGGTAYLMPTPEMDKIYDIKLVPDWLEMKDGGLIIGAGGLANPVDGRLSEMIPNFYISPDKDHIFNLSHSCRVIPETGDYKFESVKDQYTCRQLASLYVSEGKQGKVVEVRASGRTSKMDFLKIIKMALEAEYGSKPVAVGGTFRMTRGKANIHVMPGYSATPLLTNADVTNWLKFYDMNSPLVMVGYLVSHDPGYNLRLEHFHCFSDHGDGGHFHYDVTPTEVEYIGYFNIPEFVYRVDRWSSDHHSIDYAD